MFNQSKVVSIVVGLGFFLALTPNIALTQETESEMAVSPAKISQYQKIEQPLNLKVAVTLGGLGLISAELWWFMFSKAK